MKDIPECTKLLRGASERYTLSVAWDEEMVCHALLPRDEVVYSYVIEAEGGGVTDLISFYAVPSVILTAHDKEDEGKVGPLPDTNAESCVRNAYLYYVVSTSTSLEDLIRNALILAKAEGANEHYHTSSIYSTL